MTDLSPETVGKLVALVRRMALADKAEFLAMGTGCREAYAEADAIVAELPEPVDPDLVEARELAARCAEALCLDGLAKLYRDGRMDEKANALRSVVLNLGMPS